jgi:hypothetical protein
VHVDILANRRFQLLDASEHAAPNPFVREFGEPSLHQIQPRTVRRCEVDMEPRTLSQPRPDDRRFVSAVVIQDEMDIQPDPAAAAPTDASSAPSPVSSGTAEVRPLSEAWVATVAQFDTDGGSRQGIRHQGLREVPQIRLSNRGARAGILAHFPQPASLSGNLLGFIHG